jgi:drug/metabolite transporter (DMT)-like permease
VRGYVPLLLLLAAIWGATFMFIKIAVDELAPTTTMALRLVLSAIPLLAIVVLKHGLRAGSQRDSLDHASRDVPGDRQHRASVHAHRLGRDEDRLRGRGDRKRLDADLRCDPRDQVQIERTGDGLPPRRVMLGLLGVAVLTGINPKGGWAGVAGTLAVVVASISYAVATLYTQGLLDDVHNDVLAATSVTWGAVFLTPLGAVQAPSHFPSWGVIASVLALALLGTVAGQLIYFRMIYRYGSARSSLVVYLLPVTALFYGALLLDEPITVSAIVGLVLILTGTALGSGVLRLPRRAAVPAAP